VDLIICLGAIVVVYQAVWMKQYFWAAGFVAIAIVFSPLVLVAKIFFLMGVTSIAVLGTLVTAWKMEPLPAA
jgi:hypothetical protein